jgi:putative aldouronate transport system permease protein
MNAGWLLNVSFEVPYLLGSNGVVAEVSETIDIFVLNRGFKRANGYSFGTAAGMFKTVVSVIILSACNFFAGLAGEEKLY